MKVLNQKVSRELVKDLVIEFMSKSGFINDKTEIIGVSMILDDEDDFDFIISIREEV